MQPVYDAFKIFWLGFLKGARETPRLYFLPAFAIWKCCRSQQHNQTEKLALLIFSATALALAAYLLIHTYQPLP